MKNYTVYLAGPIAGLTYEEATGWRDYCVDYLARYDIIGLSPLRKKEYLKSFGSEPLYSNADEYKKNGHVFDVMATNRGIMTRDRFDAGRCDILFVNFLGAKRAGIGTCMELGIADTKRTPIVAVMEDEGNIHDHAMINEVIGFRLNNLEDALEVVVNILKGH